jgi:hypothetical protein
MNLSHGTADKANCDIECIDLYNFSAAAGRSELVTAVGGRIQRKEMEMRDRFLFAALCGGLVAGTLDIGMAALLNSVSPLVALLFIASGILGKTAYHAGLAGVLLGLGLQWVMSLVIAAIYIFGSRRLTLAKNLLKNSWALGGVLYGFAIFFVMSYIVVPFSAAVPKPVFTLQTFAENLLAMTVFGLIIAFFAHRFAAMAPGRSD